MGEAGIDETEEWARLVSGSSMGDQGSKRLLTLPLGLRHTLKKNSGFFEPQIH